MRQEDRLLITYIEFTAHVREVLLQFLDSLFIVSLTAYLNHDAIKTSSQTHRLLILWILSLFHVHSKVFHCSVASSVKFSVHSVVASI